MNIEYRTLLPAESKAYRKLRLESLQRFPDSFSANFQEALQSETLGLEKDIENQTLEKFVYGAFLHNELIGICAVVKNAVNIVALYQMYVQEAFQGRNIGFKLVEATIKEARIRYGCNEIFLEVANDNVNAYNLYRKIGFETVTDKEINNACRMKYIVNI